MKNEQGFEMHRALLVYGDGRTEWRDDALGGSFWQMLDGRRFRSHAAHDGLAPISEHRPFVRVYLEVVP